MTEPKLITESYGGALIPFQSKDAFVNATAMCATFGKRPVDFLRLPSTESFQLALAEELGFPPSELVMVRQGGNQRVSPLCENLTTVQGTWLHPDLALECARWLSPKFSIWCNRIIRKILSGELEVNPAFQLPKTFSEALLLAGQQAAKIEQLALENGELSSQNELMAPKAALCDIAMMSKSTLGVNEAAKLLGVGEKKLFEFLRREKILRNGEKRRLDGSKYTKKWHNTPYEKYLKIGYFDLVEFPHPTRDHGVRIQLTTKVFQKGLEFIRRKLMISGMITGELF